MDKKSLKVKIFLNLFGNYKEVCQVADVCTTSVLQIDVSQSCYKFDKVLNTSIHSFFTRTILQEQKP